MYFGVLDKPEAALLERFAAYLEAGGNLFVEEYDEEKDDWYKRQAVAADEREIVAIINDFLRENC